MSHLSKRALFGIVVVALVCAGCAGSGGATASGTPPMATGLRLGEDAGTVKIAGQYVGTAKDIYDGSGHVTGSFAQSKSSAGGWLAFVYSKTRFTTATVTTLSGTSVSGSSVANLESGACTFSITGKYDSSTNKLSGSYKAVHGCTGDHGTYTLKQKCYYVQSEDIRPEVGGKPC
jgi:hypothetical protein